MEKLEHRNRTVIEVLGEVYNSFRGRAVCTELPEDEHTPVPEGDVGTGATGAGDGHEVFSG